MKKSLSYLISLLAVYSVRATFTIPGAIQKSPPQGSEVYAKFVGVIAIIVVILLIIKLIYDKQKSK